MGNRNDKLRQLFGQKIKNAREKARLTQEEVAERAAITTNYFARIERGEENPSLEIIYKICKALNIKSNKIMPF